MAGRVCGLTWVIGPVSSLSSLGATGTIGARAKEARCSRSCGLMTAGTPGHVSILAAARVPRQFLTEPLQRFLSACKLTFPSCVTLRLCVILGGLPCLGLGLGHWSVRDIG